MEGEAVSSGTRNCVAGSYAVGVPIVGDLRCVWGADAEAMRHTGDASVSPR